MCLILHFYMRNLRSEIKWPSKEPDTAKTGVGIAHLNPVLNDLHTKALLSKSRLLHLSPAFSQLGSNRSSVLGASMLHRTSFPPSECQNCQPGLSEMGTSARSKNGDFPGRVNWNFLQLQKQNQNPKRLSYPWTCNLGSVSQLETKVSHCSCSLLLITFLSVAS